MKNNQTGSTHRVGVSAEGHRLARQLSAQRGEPIYVAAEYALRLALGEAERPTRPQTRQQRGALAKAQQQWNAMRTALENCGYALAELGAIEQCRDALARMGAVEPCREARSKTESGG